MKRRRTDSYIYLILMVWMSFLPTKGRAEAEPAAGIYEISISNITYEKVHTSWLLIPTSVDLRVSWQVTTRETVQQRRQEVAQRPQDLPFVYEVSVTKKGVNTQPILLKVRRTDSVVARGLQVGDRYSIQVRVLDENGIQLSASDASTILVGKDETGTFSGLNNRNWLYYAHPGRWQLAAIGKTAIYDHSTTLGKAAFIFLSVTCFFSCLILVLYASRTLYLGNVFPYKRSTNGLFWSMFFSCDVSYENRLTNKFRFVLNAWEMTAKKSKLAADKAVKSIPEGLSSTEKMASIDVACMEYWMTDGDRAIGTIEDIMSYPYDTHRNGTVKSPDDLLTELVIKIEDSFHEIVHDGNAEESGNGAYKEDMNTLVEEIYEPVSSGKNLLSRLRTWLLRKGVLELKKGLRPFPTSRIIHAGLGIHRINGYRWLKPTEEVKRAFEDRASNEIELLKRKSKIEWFWNYGALAPLVGLFGTVTGITYAFQQLAGGMATADFTNTIELLSNGIFEALWTTIFGLANGIFFVVIYYYYKHKLDWIYSKWEAIYVTITEKL